MIHILREICNGEKGKSFCNNSPMMPYVRGGHRCKINHLIAEERKKAQREAEEHKKAQREAERKAQREVERNDVMEVEP